MKNRIKVLRAENNWSQVRLAEQLSVSRQTINAIETGKSEPSLPLAFGIAHVFGKKIEEIFSFDPDSKPAKREGPAVVSPPKSEAPQDQLSFPELDVSLM